MNEAIARMLNRYEPHGLGDLGRNEPLTRETFLALAEAAVESLDVEQARREVEPFVKTPESLTVWSKEFFHDIIRRIIPV